MTAWRLLFDQVEQMTDLEQAFVLGLVAALIILALAVYDRRLGK